jgi:hypothetical protein
MAVEAVDLVSVSVAHNLTNVEIDVQPGAAAQVGFLLIRADQYSSDLVYRVNDVGNPAIVLDQPHVLSGAGAIGLLGAAPTRLFVTNATGADATVYVLAGRDATSQP